MSTHDSQHPAEKRLYELWAELHGLDAAEALLVWDQETQLASGGHGPRGEVLATLAAFKHRLLVSTELRDVLAQCAELVERGGLGEDSVLAAQVTAARHAVDRSVRVPEDLKREIAEARSESHVAWQEARAKADFSIFEKPLARLVDLRRQEAKAITGDSSDKPAYDAMIDGYEPGGSSSELAVLFQDLTSTLTPLVRAVAESGVRVDESPALGHFPGAGQVELGRRAVTAFGYDFEGGRIDKSAHPFCIRIHRRDVRMTYRYQEDDFRSCLFGILHESGHGMYEQGLPEAWNRTPVDDSVSIGIHESQSLLWENHVGRSRGFLRWLLPQFAEIFPDAAARDVEKVWPTLHTVQPSLIRVDADETTYNLHVAIRFELEQALFAPGGDLQVKDLPGAWNERYEKYLGIRPGDDAEGVMQDVHWAHGMFGYFPTYTLGMLTSAQLMAAIRRDLGDLDEAFAAGEFGSLLAWLRQHIHEPGRTRTSAEIIEEATGRRLETTDFVDYLRRNIEEVYGVAA